MNMTFRAISLAAALAFNPSAFGAAPKSTVAAQGVYRMALGDFEVSVLSDGTVTIPLDKQLTGTAPATVASALAHARLTPMTETSINAFLINTGDKLVLVDTGAGDLFKPSSTARAGQLQASLKAAGYEAEQVDAVLLTHIHGDHSGGLSSGGKALFPNAVVHVARREAGFWLDQKNQATAAPGQQHGFAEAEAALRPYLDAGRVKLFDGAAGIVPGIRALPTYGHTPGHALYAVESRGQKLMLWGDLIHAAPVQFPYPATTIRFDVDSGAAGRQRARAMADAARQGYWVGAAHISFPGIGHVRKAARGYDWVPANYGAW